MTTLHVDREALDRAVAGYPVVRRLEVQPDFPHGLSVKVVEYQPAAIAVSDAGRVPVAGDGTILRGVKVEGSLPTVAVDGALGTEFLVDRGALGAAAVAGGAPAVLRGRIADVERRGDDGYVAELRDGPELIFGPATQLRAKWAAAARVLADLEARGASYVDLRIPDRPAVGGLAATTLTPVAPAGTAVTVPPASSTDAGAVTPSTRRVRRSELRAHRRGRSAHDAVRRASHTARAAAHNRRRGRCGGRSVNPQLQVELYTNSRLMVESWPARFVAGTVDTFRESRLQSDACGSREPSTTA